MDITNYLAAGTSYSNFLKAYDIEEAKGFFPYEYLTSTEKLQERQIPPHSAFYSSLKEKNITAEEYKYCQDVWCKEKMETMQDFLVWYNNQDVGPFVKAVEKLQTFYFERGIDVFKESMSVPGVARQMLFKSSEQMGAVFALFGEPDKDLFQTVKNNIIGGPSIIFNRYAKVGETFLRGRPDKPCKKIVGYDANALYLWALNQEMPTGPFIRRRRDKEFAPESRDKYMSAYYWMDWLREMTGQNIKHKMNYGREKRVGPYPVDGFCSDTDTIFQFHGCYFHGHDCYITKSIKNKEWRERRLEKLEKTQATTAFLRDQGYDVTEMWECEFRQLKKNSSSLKKLIDARSPQFFRSHKGKVTEDQILRAVNDGTLFGMIEVDISVPEQWPIHIQNDLSPYDYFEEMAPLFCTSDVPFELIGSHMQEYVKSHGLSEKPRRLLIGGMKARKLLLASPLLRWYLQHGLRVTHIYQVAEYIPMRCFQTFVTQVSEARREGDKDVGKKVIGETNKTIGNSAYGGLIMDKTKHTNVKYVHGIDSAMYAINDPRFINLTELDNDVYEIELAKKNIILDLPIQLGYFILQYAKLRMLEFYYDFMDKYVDRSDFSYCEMDTDSAYMAIAGEDLSSIIKPDMKYRFELGIHGFCHMTDVQADSDFHWFPRECCSTHAKYDKRTPGLFKLEFEGYEMVSLCSKTYLVSQNRPVSKSALQSAQNLVRKARKLKTRDFASRAARRRGHPGTVREYKFSCKGISKKFVQSPLLSFKGVLRTQKSASGYNKGFRARSNTIFTYQQEREGFSYFYCKRQVQENGTDTKVLDIVLCPERLDDEDRELAAILCELADE
ncbi:hypothetical protein FSP39_009262 [Pinctada imbricata]|uniref:DNA-directed DNA polymerase n=1 Tax=Pinctada imbricata TaxID=66713 RepID=A0AA89BLS7_PINIB|nr:hypothetical protein FSP39_009262 [Pinctada imbricata]